MSKKVSFVCEFEDLGPTKISYEMTGPPVEEASVAIEGGVPVLYVNKGACKLLAEIFAKLAISSYRKGFHVHLHKNFNSDDEEMLRVILS